MSRFVVREIVTGVQHQYDDHHHVRFPVRPPIFETNPPESQFVRLIQDEGWIDVVLHGDHIEVRGAHGLAIEPASSNSVIIKLRDEDAASKAFRAYVTPPE